MLFHKNFIFFPFYLIFSYVSFWNIFGIREGEKNYPFSFPLSCISLPLTEAAIFFCVCKGDCEDSLGRSKVGKWRTIYLFFTTCERIFSFFRTCFPPAVATQSQRADNFLCVVIRFLVSFLYFFFSSFSLCLGYFFFSSFLTTLHR